MNGKLNNSMRNEHQLHMSSISFDDSFNLEHLKTFNSQNFTAILNNPIPQYTFIGDIYTKISDNFYMDYGTDFDKFNDLNSPQSQNSTQSSKTLKDLISESYDMYLGKIEKILPTFKRNHTNKNGSDFNTNDKIKLVNRNKIYSLIEKEFFESNYKIKDEILNLRTNRLFNCSEEFSEKCGDIDYELNKMVTNSAILFNYINNNFNFGEKINTFLEKIKFLK